MQEKTTFWTEGKHRNKLVIMYLDDKPGLTSGLIMIPASRLITVTVTDTEMVTVIVFKAIIIVLKKLRRPSLRSHPHPPNPEP
jgi:hypothetical protein